MSTLTVEDLARRLTLTANEAPVDALLNSLSPESAHYFRLCCIPHVFDERLLRIIDPSLTEAEAREQCDELTALPPVGIGEDAFAVNHAARKLVFGQWFQAERLPEFREVSERLAEHFLATATGSEAERKEARRRRLFHLLGQSIDVGFAEFARQFASALESHDLSACEQLVRLVREYDAILPPRLALELRYHEGTLAIELGNGELAERALDSLQNEAQLPLGLKARTLHRLGQTYAMTRDWPKAERRYRDALALLQGGHATDDLEYRLHHDLGVVGMEQGNTELADQMIARARELATAASDEKYVAITSHSLATLRQRVRRTAEAVTLFEQTVEVLKKLGDRRSLARVYENLAAVHSDSGNLAESKRCLLEGLQAARDARMFRAEGELLASLSHVHRELGDLPGARKAAIDAFTLFLQLRDGLAAGLVKRQEARVLRAEGQTDLSRQAYQESIDWLEPVAPMEAAAARAELASARPKKLDLPWYAWGALMVIGLAIVTLIVIVAIVRAS